MPVSCLAVELLHGTMGYLRVGSCEAPGFGILYCARRGLVKFNGQHSGGVVVGLWDREGDKERPKRDEAKQDGHA